MENIPSLQEHLIALKDSFEKAIPDIREAFSNPTTIDRNRVDEIIWRFSVYADYFLSLPNDQSIKSIKLWWLHVCRWIAWWFWTSIYDRDPWEISSLVEWVIKNEQRSINKLIEFISAKMQQYQQDYEALNPRYLESYLECVDDTRKWVIWVLEKALTWIWEKSRETLEGLEWELSIVITKLFNMIASDDILGYSENPWTKLRHDIKWLASAITTCLDIITDLTKISSSEDWTVGFTRLTPEEAKIEVAEIIKNALLEFKNN